MTLVYIESELVREPYTPGAAVAAQQRIDHFWLVNMGQSIAKKSELIMRRWCGQCLIAFLLVPNGVSPAWAWGRLGHRVIARLAEHHIGPVSL